MSTVHDNFAPLALHLEMSNIVWKNLECLFRSLHTFEHFGTSEHI